MKKTYDDDDGRTIADMSGVDRQSVFSGLFVGLRFGGSRERRRRGKADAGQGGQQMMDREERRGYIFGAMSAAIVIALIILAVFAIAILLILWIGHAL